MIPYRAMLDVPADLLRYLSRLLSAERRRRGTPARSRKLTCREQALLALRWFRDRTRPERLAADHGVSRATACYEASDMCLRRLARSPACGLTSATVRLVVACGGARLHHLSLSRRVPFTDWFTDRAPDLAPTKPGCRV